MGKLVESTFMALNGFGSPRRRSGARRTGTRSTRRTRRSSSPRADALLLGRRTYERLRRGVAAAQPGTRTQRPHQRDAEVRCVAHADRMRPGTRRSWTATSPGRSRASRSEREPPEVRDGRARPNADRRGARRRAPLSGSSRCSQRAANRCIEGIDDDAPGARRDDALQRRASSSTRTRRRSAAG